jgi:predicted O-linked N-acetylglucosamine transferase (SPINDLY family)
VRRVGLADVVLDTWPYTAHTPAADAIWGGEGVPWLALDASDDRMDSLLSSAVLASIGGLPLRARSLRAFEDSAVAFAGGASPSRD